MKKILFTASITKHILRFHLPYLQWLQEQGYETHVACLGDEVLPFTNKQWNIPFVRSPFSIGHLTAYQQLKKIIEQENFSLIHCHTPMASVVTRLASVNTRKLGTTVLYTAHGFHFYKGGPAKDWLTYYPVERLLFHLTDAVITINTEDFEVINKLKSKDTRVYKIPGIGVNSNRFFPISVEEKQKIRIKNSYATDDFILVYAAEFIERKNHQFIIDAFIDLKKELPKCKVLFAGRGKLGEILQKKVHELKLTEQVIFLGFRNDIDEVFKMSDLGISSSKQEGLGLNLIEEMMCGLPVVATLDRGHKEVMNHDATGYLFKQGNISEFKNYIKKLYNDKSLYQKFSKKSIEKAEQFELNHSLEAMKHIYQMYIK
jgi:glycosyltransferase EpsD